MLITITAEHIEFLRQNKIFLNSSGTYDPTWLRIGATYNTVGKAALEPYSGSFIGPRFTSIGSFSYTKSYFPTNLVTIGRYCAVAEKSQLMPSNHPQGRLSMCGFDYGRSAPYGQFEADVGGTFTKKSPKLNVGTTTIGNDVWIGQEAMLKLGITIGHGAVIGARSVVTKDVPPYAVVVGAPATVKKFRFPEQLIERLLTSEWWNYSYDQFAGMDTTDPLEFLPAFEDAKASGRLTVYPEKSIDVHAAFRGISQRAAA